MLRDARKKKAAPVLPSMSDPTRFFLRNATWLVWKGLLCEWRVLQSWWGR